MKVPSATATNAHHRRFLSTRVPLYSVRIRRPCTPYMYLVHETCTLYGCQVAGEKLSKAAVAERALRLGDEEGVEAVTIRRLAQELGVTPMALYWHFKNKDDL